MCLIKLFAGSFLRFLGSGRDVTEERPHKSRCPPEVGRRFVPVAYPEDASAVQGRCTGGPFGRSLTSSVKVKAENPPITELARW